MRFVIECEMADRWVATFISFLAKLENNGANGHSSIIGIFADGDGDFRPKFAWVNHPMPDKLINLDEAVSIQPPYATGDETEPQNTMAEVVYDAG